MLDISEIRTTCGCVSPKFSATTLLPGESVEIPVEINLSAMHGDFSGNVCICSNDVDRPEVTVTFSATVHGILDVRPRQLTLERSVGNDRLTGRIDIDFSNSPNSEIRSVSFLDAPISVSVSRMVGQVQEVRVSTVDSSIPTLLLIETTAPDEELIRIPIALPTGI